MTSLVELSIGWDEFGRAMEENDGELTPELAATLDELNLAEREKADRVVFYLKALEGEADALKKLEDEIAAKRRSKTRARESLMTYVRSYIEAKGLTVLKGDVFRFQIQKNGGKPPVIVLVDADLLPEPYRKVSFTADKEALRAGLEAGVPEAMAVAELGPVGQSLRIF